MTDKTTQVQSGQPPAASKASSLPPIPKGADAPVEVRVADRQQQASLQGGTVLDLFATPATAGGKAFTETSLPAEDGIIHDAWILGRGGAIEKLGVEKLGVMEAKLAEAIVKHDDRRHVPDPTAIPFRCICSLKMRTRTGLWGAGTGWLVGPRTVITAGHCLFMHEHGGWIQEMEIYPGRNGENIPFTARAERVMTVVGWKEGASAESDYGAVWLDRDVPNVGRFGYASLDAHLLESLECQVTGYPSDKNGTMWGHARRLLQVLDKQLEYDIDTIDGNSGGPVFVVHQGNAIAVGIHNYGNATSMRNTATRLTPSVFDNIKLWCTPK